MDPLDTLTLIHSYSAAKTSMWLPERWCDRDRGILNCTTPCSEHRLRDKPFEHSPRGTILASSRTGSSFRVRNRTHESRAEFEESKRQLTDHADASAQEAHGSMSLLVLKAR